jgi:hypothetical protein
MRQPAGRLPGRRLQRQCMAWARLPTLEIAATRTQCSQSLRCYQMGWWFSRVAAMETSFGLPMRISSRQTAPRTIGSVGTSPRTTTPKLRRNGRCPRRGSRGYGQRADPAPVVRSLARGTVAWSVGLGPQTLPCFVMIGATTISAAIVPQVLFPTLCIRSLGTPEPLWIASGV